MASVWAFEKLDERPVFRCRMLTGKNMSEWLDPVREYVFKLARDNGARYVVARGRSAWARLFPDAYRRGKDLEMGL